MDRTWFRKHLRDVDLQVQPSGILRLAGVNRETAHFVIQAAMDLYDGPPLTQLDLFHASDEEPCFLLLRNWPDALVAESFVAQADSLCGALRQVLERGSASLVCEHGDGEATVEHVSVPRGARVESMQLVRACFPYYPSTWSPKLQQAFSDRITAMSTWHGMVDDWQHWLGAGVLGSPAKIEGVTSYIRLSLREDGAMFTTGVALDEEFAQWARELEAILAEYPAGPP